MLTLGIGFNVFIDLITEYSSLKMLLKNTGQMPPGDSNLP